MLHQKRTHPKLTSKWYSKAGEAAWHAACSFLVPQGPHRYRGSPRTRLTMFRERVFPAVRRGLHTLLGIFIQSFTLGTASKTHHQGSAHIQDFFKFAPKDHWLESMCQVK